MPVIDPELLAPLSKISDVLLKRPGKVSIDGIKRLSNIYGFETFNDTLTLGDNNNMVYTVNSRAGTPLLKQSQQQHYGQIIDRLSLSGKILLIDIDFHGGNVKNVSLSSAINLQPIDGGETYDFLEGDDKFEKVESILYRNLQSSTLDKFNRNLRILSQFDRLSMSSPNDLFNLFNQLTYNLISLYKYESNKIMMNDDHDTHTSKGEISKDIERGCLGSGLVLLNQNDQIGLFLKIWEDNKYVNEYIFQKKGIKTNEMLNPYLLHFKITENMMKNGNDNSLPIDPNSELLPGGANGGGVDASVMSTEAMSIDSKNTGNSGLKLKWFDNGDWLINNNDITLNSNLNLLVLEIDPNIWIPQDLLIELNLTDYEIINHENSFFNEDIHARDHRLDRFYKIINRDHAKELKLTSGKSVKLNFLIGCEMVKIFKIKFKKLDKLMKLVETLRNWALLNNLIRNCLNDAVVADDNSIEISNTSRCESKAGRPRSPTNEETSFDYQDDLRLTDIMKENLSLMGAGSSSSESDPTTEQYITIENLKVDEIGIVSNHFKYGVKNGHISLVHGKDDQLTSVKKLSISENLATVI